MPYFDTHGWHTDTVLDGRHTDVPLPSEPLGDGQGWQWTGYAWLQMPTAPFVVEASPVARHITKRAFWGRFPPMKETVMRAVRLGAPAGALLLVGALDRLNSRVESSPFVNLDDAETVGGLEWLSSGQCPETVNLDGQALPLRLTAAERDAVLQAPVQQHEAYKP